MCTWMNMKSWRTKSMKAPNLNEFGLWFRKIHWSCLCDTKRWIFLCCAPPGWPQVLQLFSWDLWAPWTPGIATPPPQKKSGTPHRGGREMCEQNFPFGENTQSLHLESSLATWSSAPTIKSKTPSPSQSTTAGRQTPAEMPWNGLGSISTKRLPDLNSKSESPFRFLKITSKSPSSSQSTTMGSS